MKILGHYWFTNGMGTVGIVRVQTDHEGIMYYIGTGTGFSEEYDAQRIADWGSVFPTNVGNNLFGIKEAA